MRHRRLLIASILVAAGLALTAGTWTALASSGGQPGPPDDVPPVGAGPPDTVPPEDGVDGLGPPDAVPPVEAGPPDTVPPVHARIPDDVPPEDGADGLGPPDNPGERGQAVSEAAHEKVEVTNPDGETVSLSLVGFCRSQAPWMSDSGDACNVLAELFAEKGAGPGVNESDDDGDANSQGSSAAPGSRGRHLGHQRAAEVARAGFQMARGFFTHVMSLLA